MTVTELSPNGHGSTEDRARRAWRPDMDGKQLAAQIGVPDRTGRYWAGKLRQEHAATGVAAATPTPIKAARKRGKAAARRSTVRPHVKVAAAAVVAAVTAVASYIHIQHLAEMAGFGGLSWVLPLGLDGLVIVCSCAILDDREAGKRGDLVAWVGVVAGFAGSLVANVLAMDPSLVEMRYVAWALAGYTPVALLIAAEVILRGLGDR